MGDAVATFVGILDFSSEFSQMTKPNDASSTVALPLIAAGRLESRVVNTNNNCSTTYPETQSSPPIPCSTKTPDLAECLHVSVFIFQVQTAYRSTTGGSWSQGFIRPPPGPYLWFFIAHWVQHSRARVFRDGRRNKLMCFLPGFEPPRRMLASYKTMFHK